MLAVYEGGKMLTAIPRIDNESSGLTKGRRYPLEKIATNEYMFRNNFGSRVQGERKRYGLHTWAGVMDIVRHPWDKGLTVADKKHLKGVGVINLETLILTNDFHNSCRIKGDPEPCWDCRSVARRLGLYIQTERI